MRESRGHIINQDHRDLINLRVDKKFSGSFPLQARGLVTELGLLVSIGMTPHSQAT